MNTLEFSGFFMIMSLLTLIDMVRKRPPPRPHVHWTLWIVYYAGVFVVSSAFAVILATHPAEIELIQYAMPAWMVWMYEGFAVLYALVVALRLGESAYSLLNRRRRAYQRASD